MIRKGLITLSLATLCLIPAWRKILDPVAVSNMYYLKSYPLWAELFAIACNTLLFGAILFPVVHLALGRGRGLAVTAARVALLAVLVIPLNGIRVQFDALLFPNLAARLGRAGFLLLGLSLLAAVAFAVLRLGLGRIVAAVETVLLILSPFPLVAFAQATWTAAKYAGEMRRAPDAAARRAAEPGRARVVWLIFDELEYRLLFAERRPTLKAPEFDRLRAESLHASHAYPPSSYTDSALPALTTGRLVARGKPAGPNELSLWLDGQSEPVSWITLPTIFSRASEAGYRVAATGWTHPYCRLFGASLTKCFEGPPEEQKVFDKILWQARESVITLPGVHRLTPARVREANFRRSLERFAALYLSIQDAGKSYASDPGLDLVFIHQVVPHSPNFYDRARGQFAFDRKNSYLDSVALADRALGELRRAMEEAGLWESTSLIVSSDHWWRGKELHNPAGKPAGHNPFWSDEDKSLLPEVVDERVPFMLKLAGQRQGMAYEQPFNTVLTHDLALAILRGEIAEPAAAAAWLDANKTIAKSPYYKLGASAIQLSQ